MFCSNVVIGLNVNSLFFFFFWFCVGFCWTFQSNSFHALILENSVISVASLLFIYLNPTPRGCLPSTLVPRYWFSVLCVSEPLGCSLVSVCFCLIRVISFIRDSPEFGPLLTWSVLCSRLHRCQSAPLACPQPPECRLRTVFSGLLFRAAALGSDAQASLWPFVGRLGPASWPPGWRTFRPNAGVNSDHGSKAQGHPGTGSCTSAAWAHRWLGPFTPPRSGSGRRDRFHSVARV